ncbi:MAG: DeoR family transcriptional regulator [Pseudonocardiaceae bacterium]|nr:DeoR family transcriptional regulator [Pseudonocardiaceae bacterium]
MSSRRARPPEAVVEERRQDVLRHVIEHGEARIDELGERFGVSLMTMHRDLDDLAERGLLRKLRGKVAAFPALTMEIAARFREGLHLTEKEALGAAAVGEISAGQTVFVDCSTTVFPLVNRMREIEPLTVVTNSLRVVRILGPCQGIETVLIGGRYNNEFDSCAGPDVVDALGDIRADVGFISATAVAGGRLFHPVQDYAALKNAARGSVHRNVLLVDHSKFGKTATYAHGEVSDYDLVIVDSRTPEDEIDAMIELGAAVRVVALEETAKEE